MWRAQFVSGDHEIYLVLVVCVHLELTNEWKVISAHYDVSGNLEGISLPQMVPQLCEIFSCFLVFLHMGPEANTNFTGYHP